jgi:hypothetical protein
MPAMRRDDAHRIAGLRQEGVEIAIFPQLQHFELGHDHRGHRIHDLMQKQNFPRLRHQ